MADIMEYIASHRDEVEQEYQAVLQHAEENRQYWETRHRQRQEQIAPMPPKPGQEKIRAKLQAAKAKLGME
jgi:hypothetical protein